MIERIENFKVDAVSAPVDIDARIGTIACAERGIPESEVRSWRIRSKSIDSRRGHPQLVYTIRVDRACGDAAARLDPEPQLELPESRLLHPVVVGTGPAGIFAALALAMAGTRPLILDAGPEVDRRYHSYREFLKTRELSESANLLIGEGGAGTFSDGKLYTGTRDERSEFILAAFAAAGAAPEIRYLKRPHIGSDRLREVALRLRKRIIELGGSFRFGARVTAPLVRGGRCEGVVLENGETVSAPAVLIAHGLGGRALTARLLEFGVAGELKPFQVGCRIEHPQSFIDRTQYRLTERPVALGAAEYHLVSRPGKGIPGVSSFCMCPGGEVLNATAWRERSVTNGMSDFARSGEFGNACLIITLDPAGFGSIPAAYRFLEELERKTFSAGGGDYTLPAQQAAAFLKGCAGPAPGPTSCRIGVTAARLDRLLPAELTVGIRGALRTFDRNLPGFLRYGTLIGAETCVSSPVRFLRDPQTKASNLPGLYLAGEGAGAAGGIMSAAVDGIRLAEAMLQM